MKPNKSFIFGFFTVVFFALPMLSTGTALPQHRLQDGRSDFLLEVASKAVAQIPGDLKDRKLAIGTLAGDNSGEFARALKSTLHDADCTLVERQDLSDLLQEGAIPPNVTDGRVLPPLQRADAILSGRVNSSFIAFPGFRWFSVYLQISETGSTYFLWSKPVSHYKPAPWFPIFCVFVLALLFAAISWKLWKDIKDTEESENAAANSALKTALAGNINDFNNIIDPITEYASAADDVMKESAQDLKMLLSDLSMVYAEIPFHLHNLPEKTIINANKAWQAAKENARALSEKLLECESAARERRYPALRQTLFEAIEGANDLRKLVCAAAECEK